MQPFSLTSRDNTAQVASIGALLKSQPWALGAHAHPGCDRLFWVNKGAGRIQLDGAIRGLSPNTAIFVPAGVVHALSLAPVSAGWAVTLPGNLPFDVPLPRNACQFAIQNRAEQASITSFCDEIFNEQANLLDHHQTAIACHASLLAIWLNRLLERHPSEMPKPTSSQALHGKFVRLLEERFAHGDTSGDYAAALGVTTTHLARVTRSITQKGVTQLIQERVLLEARAKLAYGDANIAAIATGLGFRSAAYFTRVFSQGTGSTPSNFRKTARSSLAISKTQDLAMHSQ